MIRLDKFMVNLGLGSRTEIKSFAKNGKVSVNGVTIYKSETKINELEDDVYLHGKKVLYKKYTYIMLNKKAGYVTATKDNHDKTVFELLDEKYAKLNLFAVGRLDKDTEGFLLLTNNGELSHGLMSPKKHVDKTYYVKTSEKLLEEHIDIFKKGIEFKDGTKLKPAKLEILSENEANVTISEGKYHQVKNMFRVIDMHVLFLKRVSIANLPLDATLDIGEYRELTQEEETYLLEVAGLL